MFTSKRIALLSTSQEDKAILSSFIEQEHGQISSSINKSTHMLISNSSMMMMNNQKKKKKLVAMEKAIKFSIPILSVDEFKQKFIFKDEEVNDEVNGKKKRKSERKEEELIMREETESARKRVKECKMMSLRTNLVVKSSLVNRVESSRQILQALMKQQVDSKGIIPILSQERGSGKTTLVENFRLMLKEEENYQDIHLEKLMKAALVRIDMGVLIDYPITYEQLIVDRLSLEVFECIQTALFKLRENNIQDEVLENSYRIITDLLDGNFPLVPKSLQETSRVDVFSFLCEWSKLGLYPLLMFFDECGKIEKIRCLSVEIPALVQFYNSLSNLVGAEKNVNNIFVILAGKLETLAQLGKQQHSNAPSQYFVLDVLSLYHVMGLLETALVSVEPQVTAKEFLLDYCKLGKNYEYFCEALQKYSRGLPGLVVSTISFLMGNYRTGNPNELSSRNNIDELFLNLRKNP